jgi:DNA-binding MarR family transcriptional regulator
MYNYVCDEVFGALRRIVRSLDVHSNRLRVRYGLTGPQLVILKKIESTPNCSVRNLAEAVSLSSATVTVILESLEKKGLVNRSRGKEDRRRMENVLTEKARQILALNPSLLRESFVEEFLKLPEWEQTSILSSLQRLAFLMESEEQPVAVTEDEFNFSPSPI